MTISIYDIMGGNKTAKGLDGYIKRLEKGKVKGLTEKQVCSLIKVARVLRTTLPPKQVISCSKEKMSMNILMKPYCELTALR